jgi:hypothetical protein
MINPLLESMLDEAMEEAIADAAEDGVIEASELLECFAEEVAENPLLRDRLNSIQL